MGRMIAQLIPQDGEHDCIQLKVTDAVTGRELFHAEIWDFSHGNGSGDIDIFAPDTSEVTVLEWEAGAEFLRHHSVSNHIAVDFKSTLPEVDTKKEARTE